MDEIEFTKYVLDMVKVPTVVGAGASLVLSNLYSGMEVAKAYSSGRKSVLDIENSSDGNSGKLEKLFYNIAVRPGVYAASKYNSRK